MKAKQVLVLLSGLCYSLGVGFAWGISSIMTNALMNRGFQDDGNSVDGRELTFLHMSKSLSSAAGFLILPIVMQIFGRKIAHILLNISLIISFIVFILAKHIGMLHVAEVIQGISDTGIFVEAIILSEFCHKKQRGIFMSMEKAAEVIGLLICDLLQDYISWRYLYVVGLVPPCLAIGVTIFWPESPYFHAMNGKYADCQNSFFLLHGDSEKQRRELQSIVTAEQKKLQQVNQKPSSMILNMFRKFLDKSFWKTFFIVNAVLGFYLSVSIGSIGSEYLVSFNSHRFFASVSVSYKVSICLHTFMLIAWLLSCSIILIERRTVLFVFGFIIFLFSFLTSLLASGLKDYSFIVTLFSIFYIFLVKFSVLPVSAILIGELYFLEHRGIGMFASGIVFVVLQLILSITYMPLALDSGFNFVTLNLAWIAAFCLIILFFTLPETSDKTLHEIENELRGVKEPVKSIVPDAPASSVEMGQLLPGGVKPYE